MKLINYKIELPGTVGIAVIGVVACTFALFNIAAGDPAAAALGKNARPEEIESFRRMLGADLPLFFGEHVTVKVQQDGDLQIFGHSAHLLCKVNCFTF